jgi:urea transporter
VAVVRIILGIIGLLANAVAGSLVGSMLGMLFLSEEQALGRGWFGLVGLLFGVLLFAGMYRWRAPEVGGEFFR